jgi:putative membrane protein
MRHTKAVLLLAAAVAAVACGKKDNDDSTDTTAVSSTSSVSDTAIGAPIPGHAALSDANILAQEKGGDSAEVAVATLAKSTTKDAGVRAYAQRLITDHGKGGKEVEAVIKKTSINPEPASDDTTATATSHTIDHLKSLTGADFDTAFVNHEIQDHQTDIADAHNAADAAVNADVKALVQKSIPELQTHLDLAQKLADKLSKAKK